MNAFYTGRFPGSFARGLPFQENPATGDCRVSGTLAALAGLEQALALDDARLVDHAVRRILLLHGMVVALGGVPVIYSGDEVAQLNDLGFAAEPGHAADNRWVHRPRFDWDRLERARTLPESAEGRVFHGLKRLLALRRDLPMLAGNGVLPVALDPRYLAAFQRVGEGRRLLVVGNFHEHPVPVARADLVANAGGADLFDHAAGRMLDAADPLLVEPYAFHLLEAQP